MSMRIPRLLAATAFAVVLLGAPAAHAAGDLEVGIADDAAFLKEPDPARAARLAATWADLGVDTVRLFATWNEVSPQSTARRVPAGFDPANPDDPGYDWALVDRAVDLVNANGMRVVLTVSGPGPLWASGAPARADRSYKPHPDLFAKFARAVALRYGAAVDRYLVWNEPNLPLWLKPQFSCVGRRCTPSSPHHYRRLFRAAYAAIHTADPVARVLFGVLAPRGSAPRSRNANMRPLAFMRALGCVDARLRRTRSGPCTGFKPLTADGFSYHPHGVTRAPDVPNPNPDEASLADLPRLLKVLDQVQLRGGWRNARGGRFELYFTEYGYQTSPPDRGRDGVSLAKQSRWLQQAAYLSWRHPRVKNLIQYEWRDEPLRSRGGARQRYAGWQSGLNFANGRAKPALRTFASPFWVDVRPGSGQARLWGQVRPGTSHTVTVQRRRPGTKRWTTVRNVVTDGRGFWTLRQGVRSPTEYRFTWQPLDEYGGPAGPRRSSDAFRADLLRRGPARRN